MPQTDSEYVQMKKTDLQFILDLLEEFADDFVPDEDSCMGMAFFKARISEDHFFSVKFGLERNLGK